VRRICKKLGIDPIAFHALRATFLTHAAEAGLPISQLRALAGHADITTTAIYLRSDSARASADDRARLSFARPDARCLRAVHTIAISRRRILNPLRFGADARV
jgi:integrase